LEVNFEYLSNSSYWGGLTLFLVSVLTDFIAYVPTVHCVGIIKGFKVAYYNSL